MANIAKLERWRTLFSQYHQCDLTVAEFCQRHQVRIHQFYYWRDKVDAGHASESECQRSLIPLQLATPQSIERHDDLHIRLPNGVEVMGLSVEQLQDLLPQVSSL